MAINTIVTLFCLKRYYPLYVGISTGLCGSITSFSSFELATFRAVINDGIGYGVCNYTEPHFLSFYSIRFLTTKSIYQIMAGLTHVMITIGMSVAAFWFGKDLTELVTSKYWKNKKKRM